MAEEEQDTNMSSNESDESDNDTSPTTTSTTTTSTTTTTTSTTTGNTVEVNEEGVLDLTQKEEDDPFAPERVALREEEHKKLMSPYVSKFQPGTIFKIVVNSSSNDRELCSFEVKEEYVFRYLHLLADMYEIMAEANPEIKNEKEIIFNLFPSEKCVLEGLKKGGSGSFTRMIAYIEAFIKNKGFPPISADEFYTNDNAIKRMPWEIEYFREHYGKDEDLQVFYHQDFLKFSRYFQCEVWVHFLRRFMRSYAALFFDNGRQYFKKKFGVDFNQALSEHQMKCLKESPFYVEDMTPEIADSVKPEEYGIDGDFLKNTVNENYMLKMDKK